MNAKHFILLCGFMVIALAAVFALAPVPRVEAAAITWIAASSSIWNTSSSWSTGAVPTASDTALFSASSTQNATIANSMSVGGIQIVSGYTGTIIQNSNRTITIGSSGYSQAAGTFTGSGSADNITVNGPFNMTGGIFTSTKGGALILYASSTFSSGFQNNSGTVQFSSTSTQPLYSGSSTFYQLWLGTSDSNNNYITIATGTVFTVQATTTFGTNFTNVYLLGGGELDVQGNVLMNYYTNAGGNNPTSTFNWVFNGSSTQSVNTQTFGNPPVPLMLPSVTINKTGGMVNFNNNIFVSGNWNNQTPSYFNAGTSTVSFDGLAPTLTGSTTFYALSFNDGYVIANKNFTIATDTVLTVQSSTIFAANNSSIGFLGGGEVDAQGDVVGGHAAQNVTSTASLVLNGTGTQTIDVPDNTGSTDLFLPNATINKVSGGVVLENTIAFAGNWSNLSGTAINPGTSTVTFVNPATLMGSSTFYALAFGNGVNATFTIATGTVITAQATTTLNTSYTNVVFSGGGEIDAQGNVNQSYFSGSATTGTINFVLNGVGNQTVDGSFNLYLPNFLINKTSGLALATGTAGLVSAQSLTVSQGEFRLGSTTLQTYATTTVASGATFSSYPAAASTTFKLGGSLVNNGTIWFNGGGQNSCGGPDYFVLRSTVNGAARSWSGSGLAIIMDASIRDQSAASTINAYSSTNVSGNTNFSFISCPTIVQNDYRFYANSASAITPSTALAAQDAAPTIDATSTLFRLLINLTTGTSTFPTSTQPFKLQYSPSTSTGWADVAAAGSTSSAPILFYDNAALTDQAAVTSTLLATSAAGESYAESNPTATNTAGFAVGADGEWDFSLSPQNVTNTTYYFRMTKSDGTAFTTYTNYPALTVSLSAILSVTTSTSLAFTAAHGATATSSQSVVVKNTGPTGSTLSWSATSTQSWLTFSPASGSLAANATASLAFIANPAGLALGTHNATATISDPNASGSPQTFPVSLIINASGVSISLTAPTDGATVSGTTSITANPTSTLAIASVQLLLDGAPLGSLLTSSPYTYAWDTTQTTDGSHTLMASTTDAGANIATSSVITVTVSNATTTPTSTTSGLSFSVPLGYNIGLPPGYILNPTSTAPTSSLAALQAQLIFLQQQLQSLLAQAAARGREISIPPTGTSVTFPRDLQLWDVGSDVTQLQQLLIQADAGPYAKQLKIHGATRTFGLLTYYALKEYQAAQGINPTGYFGKVTRGRMVQ